MKIATIVFKILFILVLLMPILGALGVFPPPTVDLYTPDGWAFLSALMSSGYMMWLIAVTCAVCIVLVLMKRSALAAVLITPFTVNVISFHWFLDRGPFHLSASLAYILLACNAYFLWLNWNKYRVLWA